ncbi:MAG: hypothetical protein ACR2QO_00380 [Acidimicrobiales bacterium]
MSGMVLADLEKAMATADLGACSDDELSRSLRQALRARQVVDGFVNRLAGEARRREAAGSSSPAQEAGVGEVLPSVGERVDQGVVVLG